MGYMGFGMRKEVYKRKPKVPFKKLKSIYGDKLEDYHRLNKSKDIKFDEEARKKVRHKVKREIISEGLLNNLIFLIILVALVIIIWNYN